MDVIRQKTWFSMTFQPRGVTVMAKARIVEMIEELIAPCVLESGLELVDVEFVREGGSWYLRIFIDKPGGINIEDCGQLSQKIDRLLDEKDPITQSYHLEVSSPGIERPLKKISDYKRFAGELAVVTMFVPFDGKKKITGRIAAVRDDDIVLESDGKELTIPFRQVSSARLKVEF
jgi:ribosome maturation factor RimP